MSNNGIEISGRSGGAGDRPGNRRPRLHKTAADYAIIAICPALIVLMLTALTHFLVLCVYRGDYTSRLMYILFLFIVGATGIARISIEQGRSYAVGYALALAAAAFIAISRFVAFSGPVAAFSPIVNCGLLAMIWWLADRVTYDCTVIDDAAKASGEGLVDARGLFGGVGSLGARRKSTEPEDVSLDGTSGFDSDADAETDSRSRKRKKSGHQPGRWVLYLAVAALPLFGLGQLFLPGFDTIRTGALRSLGLYLFATLSLLVTTSFLGLRRYLRQRGTEMPSQVSTAWLAGGTILIAGLLLLAFLLPMPGRMVASIELPKWITSPDGLKASKFGWGKEAAEQSGDQQPGGQQSGGQQSGSQQSGSQQSGSQQSGGQQSGGQQSGGQQSGSRQSGSQQSGSRQSGSQQSGSQQSGSQQSGSQQSGGQQSGGQQSGGQQSGSRQSGSRQSGSQQSGSQQSGSQQSGSQQSGSQQSGSQQSGSQQSGGQQSGGQQSGSQQSGSQQSGSQQSGSQQSGSQQSGSQQSGSQQSGGQQSGSQQSGGQQTDGQKSEGRQQSGNRQSRESGDRKSDSSSQSGSQNPNSNSNPSSSGSWMPQLGGMLTTLFKVVIFLVLAGIIAYFVYRNWEEIKRWFNELFNRLNDRPEGDGTAAEAMARVPARVRRSFASFRNPLVSGVEANEAIITSFQALDAWGRERGWPRGDEETPSEYVKRIASQLGVCAKSAGGLVDAYNRIVYGASKATKADLKSAGEVWNFMVGGQS